MTIGGTAQGETINVQNIRLYGIVGSTGGNDNNQGNQGGGNNQGGNQGGGNNNQGGDEWTEPPFNPHGLPVSVQFRNPNIGNVLSQLDPWFRITAHQQINLANLTIRYFYSINGDQPQTFVIDQSTIDQAMITGQFVPLGPGFYNADYFFELGFTTGGMHPGDIAYVNVRLHKGNFQKAMLNLFFRV